MLKRIVRKAGSFAKSGVRAAVRMSMRGLPRGPRITRYYMYKHLSGFNFNAGRAAKVLSISNSLHLCQVLGLHEAQIVEANYPEYNILNLPFPEHEFDFVVSDQVLEHVEGNPQTAIDETWRILKPGGTMVHTTCFIYPIHAFPSDYWRYTPDALALLCQKFTKIIDVGGWGNPYIWLIVWLGLRGDGVPENARHPMHRLAMLNQKQYPIMTWVVAQK